MPSLKLTSVSKQSEKLGTGETIHFLPLPDASYAKLRGDFRAARHLANIDGLDLEQADSVLIRCHYPEDGMLAAIYLYKKAEAQRGEKTNDKFPKFDAYDFLDEEEDDEGDGLKPEEVLYDMDGRLVRLPVVKAEQFMAAFDERPPFFQPFGQMNTVMESESQRRNPFWMQGDYPLVVEGPFGHFHSDRAPFEYFERKGRLLILIHPADREHLMFGGGFGGNERHWLFELNMADCVVDKPDPEYYRAVMDTVARNQGWRIDRSVDRMLLVKELMEYRGSWFRSTVDVEHMVNKVIRRRASRKADVQTGAARVRRARGARADGGAAVGQGESLSWEDGKKGNRKAAANPVLRPEDFAAILSARNAMTRIRLPGQGLAAREELEQLIGLDTVKEELLRTVRRMKFERMRRASGYPTGDTHMAAVFMGNPGTAKTTLARIFGRLLCEEGVLENDTFLEVARKDLVGRYVGWTAPQVEQVFRSAKGGTIFIDEAYSLVGEQTFDGYSEEAMAEIIRQMENNPDTLVIFAGYPDEMTRFIREANPGLRSRLTHVIRFPDYGQKELIEIFKLFARREQFELEDEREAGKVIGRLLRSLQGLNAEGLGNGRLMRRLFKAAVGRMAERTDNNLKLMLTIDIERAAADILQSETEVGGSTGKAGAIGFLA